MKIGYFCRGSRNGFARVDAVACVAGVLLTTLVGIPILANTAGRGDRVVCMNNLRQIGRAFLEWGHTHGDVPAWLDDVQGTRGNPLNGNLWFQFYTMSNELRTPRILFDPADNRPFGRAAISWSSTFDGGLPNANYRNNAVSYFLGEHASSAHPSQVLSGDRNMITTGRVQTSVGLIWGVDQRSTAWTNDVHGLTGNLLFSDSHVEQTDTVRLRSAVGYDNHFLFPF